MDSQAAIVPLSNKDYQNMEELTASRARLQAVADDPVALDALSKFVTVVQS